MRSAILNISFSWSSCHPARKSLRVRRLGQEHRQNTQGGVGAGPILSIIMQQFKKCIDFFERKEMDYILNAYGLLKLNQRT
jgi:hypothetical protein